jgi:uncharacterized damage-inducible protein DinB
MLTMLRDLIAHKGHANASFLAVVGGNDRAACDPAILELLHHILIANRFWICAVRRVPFAADEEMNAARDAEALAKSYEKTHEEETAWLAAATEADCSSVLQHPLIPGGRCSVAQALMQVCLHSHGHRVQLAKLLRQHEMVPPQSDFIVWLQDRSLSSERGE